MNRPKRIIELTEHTTTRVPRHELSEADAVRLWQQHAIRLTVEAPSFKNGHSWELRPQGYVGFIPVSDELALRLTPKVPLRTLFGMMECAYRLNAEWLAGSFDASTLDEFYGRLAMILSRRVIDRSRRGLYREYVAESDRLPYVRGVMDVRDLMRRPAEATVQCDYHEHSADVFENRLLAWTLFAIAKSGLCTERARPTVRRAFHALQGGVTLQPYTGRHCVGRGYHRLNEDYRPMIALARFFLEHAGAAQNAGEHEMLPFIVEMNRLFEQFVTTWLQTHLPSHLELKDQERFRIGGSGELEFRVDMVVREVATGRARLVLDAKYKLPGLPSTDDVHQAVAYAEATGCENAVLVVPGEVSRTFVGRVGRIQVRTLAFDLSRPIEEEGRKLLEQVVRLCNEAQPA